MTTRPAVASLLGSLRASALSTKLALLAAVSTACVVGGAFSALRITTASEVRREFINQVHARQATVRTLEDHDRRLLLQSALMLADSPELHAALQAWRSGGGPASQRVRTLTGAVDQAFEGVDVDAMLVTDDSGAIVAQAGTIPSVRPGMSLGALPAVQAALFSAQASLNEAFGVLRDSAATMEVAAVPLLDAGFPIGVLVLGKRLDRIVPPDSDVEHEVVTSNHTVIASTLPGVTIGESWQPVWSPTDPGPATLSLDGQDYAVVTLRLGVGQDGKAVDLQLMRSLDQALDPIERELSHSFLLAGLLAVLLAGAGGAMLSRTTLRPLARFVRFLETGTATDRYAQFHEPRAPREINALTETYNHLIESLQRGHHDLEQRTIDLAKVNHRLNRQVDRRERAEQALRESEEQLRQAQKLEALGALAGGVAHDFNNILSIILGYAEIVQAELPADSSHRVDVGKISDAAVRARALVRQLLAFSRKQVLQPQVLDLNQVVTEVEPLLRPLTGEAIDLELRLAPRLGRVMADPGQIEQVIINLAVNARDAMPEGGRLVIETANVTLEHGSGHHPLPGGAAVMLAVADGGIGMDAETRRRIFEPFFTTKPVGKGTGLGLATVYGIVRQSGGNITVFSEPGQGATFRCYFPTATSDDVSVAPAAVGAPPSAGAETILLVEDEHELRELMRRVLNQRGYHVLTAESGSDALEVARVHDGVIHALVTDLVMPTMSGKDLAEQLAQQRAGLRVLFISGYSDEAIDRHGMLTPDSVYLQKPVAPDALLRSLRDLLDADLASQVIA